MQHSRNVIISSCMSLEAIRREYLLGANDAGVASSGSLGCLCVFSAEAMVESCSCSSAASLAHGFLMVIRPFSAVCAQHEPFAEVTLRAC